MLKKITQSNFLHQVKNDHYPMNCKRGLNTYFKKLRGLKMHCRALQAGKRKDLAFLDSGAGHGYFLHALCSKSVLVKQIKSVTGLSFHNFPSLSRLFGSLKDKLSWYTGFAEVILPGLESETLDVITDMYGPFAYSFDKPLIIQNYYRLLKSGGKAFVYLSHKMTSVIENMHKYPSYVEMLCKKCPNNFKRCGHTLVITKTSTKFPAPICDVRRVSVDEARKTGIFYPQVSVLYNVALDKAMKKLT